MKEIRITLTSAELSLIAEALDSHVYWQLSEERERNDGFVHYPESDSKEYREGSVEDQERWQEMERVEMLAARLSLIAETNAQQGEEKT